MVCLFIGDIPPSTDPKTLLKRLKEYGEIRNFQMKFNQRKGTKMCFFHVIGYNIIKNLIISPVVVNGVDHYCQLSQSTSPSANGFEYAFYRSCIFVNNIPFSMDNATLFQIFSEFGVVESGYIVLKDQTSKQYGFVFYEDEHSAEEAARVKKINHRGKFMIAQRFFRKNKFGKKDFRKQLRNRKNENSRKANHPQGQGTRSRRPEDEFNNNVELPRESNSSLGIREQVRSQQNQYFPPFGNYTNQGQKNNLFRRRKMRGKADPYYRPRSFELISPSKAVVGKSRQGEINLNHWNFENIRLNKVTQDDGEIE